MVFCEKDGEWGTGFPSELDNEVHISYGRKQDNVLSMENHNVYSQWKNQNDFGRLTKIYDNRTHKNFTKLYNWESPSC